VPLLKRAGIVAVTVIFCLPPQVWGQLPPPAPDRFAVSVGFSSVWPIGALADQDPTGDTWYAQSGSELTQRLAMVLTGRLGVFLEGTFPTFGMDAAAIQSDFGADPPVTEGRVAVSGWGAGLRWRGAADWLHGPYLEAGVGWWRQQVELRQQDIDPVTQTFDWARGLRGAVGWTVPLGRALALDAGITYSSFSVENEGETAGEAFTNRWTDSWIGIRFLAVLTFGGEG